MDQNIRITDAERSIIADALTRLAAIKRDAAHSETQRAKAWDAEWAVKLRADAEAAEKLLKRFTFSMGGFG